MSKGISRVIAALVVIVIIIIAAFALYFGYFAQQLGTQQLTVYALWTGAEQHNFEQVLGNFTQNTGIKVSYYGQTTQDLLISVPQQLASSSYSIDVVIAPWPSWILNNSKYLTAVDGLVTESQFPATIINPVKSGGSLWAAPFKLSGKPGFWYRPSFFQAHGLTVPTTYDEFKNTLLPAIKAVPGIEQPIASGVDASGLGWPLSDQTEGFIIGLGGYQLELDLETGPSARNWTDPQVVSVMTNLTDLLAAGYFSPPAEWTSQITKLWNGQYGIYWQGSFMTTEPQVQNISDLAFFPFPQTNGVVGATDYAVITKNAPHLDQAKQLVQYMASADAQAILVKQGGALATNTQVPASTYTPVDKTVVDFMAMPGITIIPDLDDTIGGQWQTTFWDQLKLLWANPTDSTMTNVLNTLQSAAIQQQGT